MAQQPSAIEHVVATKRYNSPIAQLLVWILAPGVGPGLMIAINLACAAMMATFLWMYTVGVGGDHAVILGFLSIGLFVSINWYFIVMLQEEKKERKNARRNEKRGKAVEDSASGEAELTASQIANKVGGPVRPRRRRKD
jgi:hypothetical protein